MMSDKPALSVLIPWFERDELRLTLAANAPFFRAQAADVLVLNCGGDSGRLRDLIAASEAAGVGQLDISATHFNKSLALNIGVSRSKSDIVLTLDADIVLLDDALTVRNASMENQSFVTIEWVHESQPARSPGNALAVAGSVGAALVNTAILEFTFPDGTTIHYQASRRNAVGNMRAGPGILLARKHDLLEIQGYNSNLETWGWEDDDILVRLQYALRLRRVQRGAALHLTHGDDRRALHGSGGRSDRLNFLKCCRNYSSGLLLGTYCSDVAWAADKITETISEVAADKPRTIASFSQTLSGPEDCGAKDMAPRQAAGSDTRPATIGELLLEAELKKSSLANCTLLHVGIGNSRLAARLSSCCRHITGVTIEETEQAKAAGLDFENYRPVVCDKYSAEFRIRLPLDAYDVIVDSSLFSEQCCQRHWKALMQNYVELLASAGSLITARENLNGSTSGVWTPTEDDLVCVAGQFGMCVTKTANGVYTLRKLQGT
jgi:N-terminal domain of galactosyltransferase